MEVAALIGISSLVFVSAAVQHASTVRTRGVEFVLSDRSRSLSGDGFAGRAARALQNNLEAALMFLPLAIVLLALSLSTPITQLACGIFLASRVLFTLAYWLGLNLVRSMSWAVGMLSIVMVFVALIIG